jgi:membrane protein DedA with SNARE-associated domain
VPILALVLLLLSPVPASASPTAWAEAHFVATMGEAEPLLRRWGYPAVGAAAALDYAGVPVPADTVLVAATMASARGDLWLPGVLAMAMLGMILGSQIGFGLGRWGGRALLRRLRVAPERVAGVERRYARWGAWLGLIAPFIDGIRQLNGFTAGLLGMTWWRFFGRERLGGTHLGRCLGGRCPADRRACRPAVADATIRKAMAVPGGAARSGAAAVATAQPQRGTRRGTPALIRHVL